MLAYIDALTGLGQAVLRGVALSLGLDADYFAAGYTARPTVLFRVFRYPAAAARRGSGWGVGEHTDYGLLTLLAQDANGGLQVRTPAGWIDVPPIEGTFVGQHRRHARPADRGLVPVDAARVRNASGRDRLSFPFFFDPASPPRSPPLPGRAAVTRKRPAALGRPGPARVQRHLRRLPAGQGVQGVPQLRREVLADEAP